MIQLVILGVMAAIPYGVYRAIRKWDISVLWFMAAAVSFLGFTGVLAEQFWGPQWAWNLAHHGSRYAVGALFQGICFLILGMNQRRKRCQTLS